MLDRILVATEVFDAWSDEPWVVEGAAVRVSLVCFARDVDPPYYLDGEIVPGLNADLTAGGLDVTQAVPLVSNAGTCFQGPVKVGPFDILCAQAHEWLILPKNPNGRPNSDVLRPWINGRDVTTRPSETWIIDFADMDEAAASLYEAPFEYVSLHVHPLRSGNRDYQRRERWWQLGRSGADLRRAVKDLLRLIVTPRVAKHRLFVWVNSATLPDSRINAIARDDDCTFGILHSRPHELWTLALGGWHGVGNDPQYTPRTGFETFPFPEGLTPDIPAADYASDPRAQAIAAAAARLNELREAWLNPEGLVRRVPEVVPGFTDRLLPVDDEAAKVLKKRTLTKLYNERPAWLADAHRALDVAVAAAYGWPADLADEDVLARLLALNLARAAAEAAAVPRARRRGARPAAAKGAALTPLPVLSEE